MKITFNKLPADFREFSQMARGRMNEPESTAGLFLLALDIFANDPDEGAKAINLLRGPRPLTPMDTQFIRDRLRGKKYLTLAYFEGASPDNNYTPHVPYVLNPEPDSHPGEKGYAKLFIKTAGADSPRPITLRQKGNEWFLWEYSSLLTGIRIPAGEDPWA